MRRHICMQHIYVHGAYIYMPDRRGMALCATGQAPWLVSVACGGAWRRIELASCLQRARPRLFAPLQSDNPPLPRHVEHTTCMISALCEPSWYAINHFAIVVRRSTPIPDTLCLALST